MEVLRAFVSLFRPATFAALAIVMATFAGTLLGWGGWIAVILFTAACLLSRGDADHG